MAIKIEFEKKGRAVELPNGNILDIPERTRKNDEKIQAILQKRESENEFEFLTAILEALFGRDGLHKISQDIMNENLDYLTAVYTASVNAFYADKIEAENNEINKQVEQLAPLTDKLKAINPLINNIR